MCAVDDTSRALVVGTIGTRGGGLKVLVCQRRTAGRGDGHRNDHARRRELMAATHNKRKLRTINSTRTVASLRLWDTAAYSQHKITK